MEAPVYNQRGESAGVIDLPTAIFGLSWNPDLVHQVVTGMAANARLGRAQTKNRGAVRGGGKKPWRQKGTGRARHGSIRSPLWRGGGVTHGPDNRRDYTHKINRRMRLKALQTILAAKWREGQILFLDRLELPAVKTRQAQIVLAALSRIEGFKKLLYRRGRRAIIAVPERTEAVARSFRNLPAVQVEETRNLNPLELVRYEHLLVVEPAKSLALVAKKSKHGQAG